MLHRMLHCSNVSVHVDGLNGSLTNSMASNDILEQM